MSELFKKLGVLLKANLRGEAPEDRPAPRGSIDLDREVESLRGRVTVALNHEARIKGQLSELQGEIERWDQAADDALRANNQEEARAALEKLRAAKRRYARLEEDLRQHELLTQELTQSVNLLASTVQESEPQSSADHERRMADVLKQAREKIATLGELVSPTRATDRDDTAETAPHEINDDLEQRRQRLSRR